MGPWGTPLVANFHLDTEPLTTALWQWPSNQLFTLWIVHSLNPNISISFSSSQMLISQMCFQWWHFPVVPLWQQLTLYKKTVFFPGHLNCYFPAIYRALCWCMALWTKLCTLVQRGTSLSFLPLYHLNFLQELNLVLVFSLPPTSAQLLKLCEVHS